MVFEGLLSVAKKERVMLEDTITAIDALKCFQFRIKSNNNNNNNEEDIEVLLLGREIIIIIAHCDFIRLSESVSPDEGIVVKIYPVLFTQVQQLQQQHRQKQKLQQQR